MLNFDEEIKKFKPILEIEGIEKSSNDDEMLDILELLQYIAKKGDTTKDKESRP